MRERDCGAGLFGGITFLVLALVALGLVRVVQFLWHRLWSNPTDDPPDGESTES